MSTRTKSKPAVSGKSLQKPGDTHKGRKSTPKQPIPVPDRLKRLFNSLCAQIDGGHFTNAIKTCDKILRLSPDDPDALRTKLSLFLHTEQYTSALELIEKDEDDSNHGFEKAYVHYRMQNEEQARNILDALKDGSGDDDRSAMHLEAQLCYREGSYRNAVDLYNQLLDTCDPHSEEHSDILTNLQAAQQHLDFIETGFLRSLDSLPASLRNSIDTLPPPPQQNTSAVAAALAASSNDTGASKTQAPVTQKKVRMSRVPKGVVPGVTPPPDPERWLKKSERSTVQQGRNKKKGGGGGGATQGSTGVDYNAGGGGTSTPSGGKGGKGKKKK
ncbi:hypothetical protein E1B28_010512 [Marasmius oreades]|uniref:Signal recognition particle subunit SRP72 n=1 Tax=Marasmius oreades TaxID=181124 RepID=A0A9P7RXB6_9AGAR|nr:uncharacterized protein E1B28_010512 [Marasmius oreades]KAG7091481.1 hypothetical protein E1B28_010512 [Marasmius oreades]